jgi:hypothetical protein
MAFNFLGTFNKTQWERYLAFARAQIPLVDARIGYLQREKDRVGGVSFDYQGGVPVTILPPGTTTYIGKLFAAYEVMGGNPFLDLPIRARNQPVYTIRGSEVVNPHTMSNGEAIGAPGLADAVTAVLSRQSREWIDPMIRARFDRLERKIRRAVDYADELELEILALTRVKAAVTATKSLEWIAEQVTGFLNDPNYRAIFDDQGKDPFGLTAYAPFSSYDVDEPEDPNLGGTRVVEAPQRQESGFVGPGEVVKA